MVFQGWGYGQGYWLVPKVAATELALAHYLATIWYTQLCCWLILTLIVLTSKTYFSWLFE